MISAHSYLLMIVILTLILPTIHTTMIMMKNLAIHRLAVSKVQIKLNNLINNHKASLKLHDDIVNLFNEYIASPNFDLNTTLKSRKSFIRSMEPSYRVTKLRPMNTEVMLHDTSRVTVPVFDAKHMILDLLTDQKSNEQIQYC